MLHYSCTLTPHMLILVDFSQCVCVLSIDVCLDQYGTGTLYAPVMLLHCILDARLL